MNVCNNECRSPSHQLPFQFYSQAQISSTKDSSPACPIWLLFLFLKAIEMHNHQKILTYMFICTI